MSILLSVQYITNRTHSLGDTVYENDDIQFLSDFYQIRADINKAPVNGEQWWGISKQKSGGKKERLEKPRQCLRVLIAQIKHRNNVGK